MPIKAAVVSLVHSWHLGQMFHAYTYSIAQHAKRSKFFKINKARLPVIVKKHCYKSITNNSHKKTKSNSGDPAFS